MGNDLILKGGLIATARSVREGDVLIRDGRIAGTGPGLRAEGARVIDCTGRLVSAGFTDIHVHLREPGFSAKETLRTGTLAAAAGGYTTVCAMPNLDPVPDSAEHLAVEQALIDRDAVIRVLPYCSITRGRKVAVK